MISGFVVVKEANLFICLSPNKEVKEVGNRKSKMV